VAQFKNENMSITEGMIDGFNNYDDDWLKG
jgi:hypothetical protein